jgi:nucleotide-binding universal stress UspA family protein
MSGADWKRICCCVDFSDASRTALEVAADLAKRTGGELTLLHAYPVPGYTFPDGSVVASPTMMQEVAEGAERHLEAWRKDAAGLGPAVVRGVTAIGEPSREIVEHAKVNGVELLVLGTHGRTGLIEHALLGSVAERVVRRAPCAVLTVRPRK